MKPGLAFSTNVVVHKANSHTFAALTHGDLAAVPPIAVHFLETIQLAGDPAIFNALGVCHDKIMTGSARNLPVVVDLIVGDLVNGNPAASSVQCAKEPVSMLTKDIVEATLLMRGSEPGSRLLGVKMGDNII